MELIDAMNAVVENVGNMIAYAINSVTVTVVTVAMVAGTLGYLVYQVI